MLEDDYAVQISTVGDFYCGTSQCCKFDHLSDEEWSALIKEADAKFMTGARNLFFWGHPFCQVIKSDLLQKLGRHIVSAVGVDNYTIEIFNTLTMYALYQEPTSRIISMSYTYNGEQAISDWVEFKHRDIWWAIDANGICPACNLVLLASNNGGIDAVVKIGHDFFWRQVIIKRLNYLVRNPETSSFWSELCYSTRLTSKDHQVAFAKLADLVEHGQKPGYAIVDPTHPSNGIVIEQKFIDTLM